MPKVNTNVPAQWHDLVTDVRTAAQGPLYTLGQYREEDGKGYRYFQFDNGTAGLTLAANLLLYQVDNDMWILTSDVSDSDRNLVKGVAISVVGDLGYGWCQTAGSATVATNGDDELFNRAWLRVRKHVGWTSFDDKHTNALFCRWLDKHNKEWHLARLDEIINGLPLVVTSQKDHARLVEALKEYA